MTRFISFRRALGICLRIVCYYTIRTYSGLAKSDQIQIDRGVMVSRVNNKKSKMHRLLHRKRMNDIYRIMMFPGQIVYGMRYIK